MTEQQILVHQVQGRWAVDAGPPTEYFDSLEDAIARAMQIFRDRRRERLPIVVVPPDDPTLWDIGRRP